MPTGITRVEIKSKEEIEALREPEGKEEEEKGGGGGANQSKEKNHGERPIEGKGQREKETPAKIKRRANKKGNEKGNEK